MFVSIVVFFIALIGFVLCISSDDESDRFGIGLLSVFLFIIAFSVSISGNITRNNLINYLDKKDYYECQYVPSTEAEKYEAYHQIEILNEFLLDNENIEGAKGLKPINPEWMSDLK